MADSLLDWTSRWLARLLSTQSAGYQPYTPSDPDTLSSVLRPGDILLIEGNQRISAAIKYLTQSTWSHAAFYIGDRLVREGEGSRMLVECGVENGCIAVPLAKYANFNTRICRPVGLSKDDRDTIIEFMVSSIGLQYDTKNIFDLARYLLPTPPVPVRWRRRMLAFGSGDPTRAICSSLIAEAFGRVRYPILPSLDEAGDEDHATRPVSTYSRREILHIRQYSLYTPRDFDLSPYFQVVKPTIESGFDYHKVKWAETPAPP